MTDDLHPLDVLGRIMLAILFVAFVGGALGCGGPPKKLQTVLSTTAVGLAETDAVVAPYVEQAGEAARAAAREIEDITAALASYDRAMAPWVAVERVLLEAKGALLTLQHAYDAWSAGAGDGEARWTRAAACAVPILMRLAEVLTRAEVTVPTKLTRALSLILPFAESQCATEEVTP